MNEADTKRIIYKVSINTLIINFLLTAVKLISGLIGNSMALVSDAIHSASDVLSTLVVMVGAKLSSKKADEKHPYGHEKVECVASLILSLMLFGTAVTIGMYGCKNIFDSNIAIPSQITAWAALISIIVKEWMYRYTKRAANKINSTSLYADAWHHRSDALSSVGALVGIAASRMGYPLMDPLASLVICVFIEKAALDIFKDAINKMVDKACDEDTEQAIRECAEKQPGVIRVDMLKTRVFGNKIYVDLEIGADGNETLRDAHAVAERVHDHIEKEFPKVKHIMVHVNPA